MTTSQTALITGASRGLGLELARALAARKWRLLIDARGKAALEAVAEELGQVCEVRALAGDISDPAHRRALLGSVHEMGGLDLLVNNASILGASPQPTLLDYSSEQIEAIYRVNLFGPLSLIQALRPEFKATARIINLSSDAAVESYEGWGGYGSSKAALDHLSATLAVENPHWKVYAVDPGDMQTQMHQEAFPGEDISDRPLPSSSVPGLLRLIEGDLASGRYKARDLG
jgi:NAD(P)-dependent dehydrogenase (short-subunit alcohol dehydrogenase family)